MAKQPQNPFHPGEILLEEFLEPLGMSQAAFAEKIGWTKARVNELIRGKRGGTCSIRIYRRRSMCTRSYGLPTASRRRGE